jgi:hypothetical protein
LMKGQEIEVFDSLALISSIRKKNPDKKASSGALASSGFREFQQSNRTWPRLIVSEDQIPFEYRSYLSGLHKSLSYTVLIPDEDYAFYQQSGYLIRCLSDGIQILEKTGECIKNFRFSKDDIQYISTGTALLFSWITIADSSRIYSFTFNTVMKQLFEPVVDSLRMSERTELEGFSSQSKSWHFEKMLYSHINSDVRALQVQNQVNFYQSEPRRLPKYFRKRVLNSHLMAVTKDELFFIQDRPLVEKKAKLDFQKIISIIPLTKISRFTTKETTDNLIEYDFILSSGQHVKRLVDLSTFNSTDFFSQLKSILSYWQSSSKF